LRIISLPKEINCEEGGFVEAARAIKTTGSPIYHHSLQIPSSIMGLLQPPTYIFTLSLFLHLGDDEIIVRSVNVLFSIFTAIFIYLFGINIIKGDRGKMIGLISSSFFMINYYVFSSSLLIDIDVLSMFFTFGFMYFILRYHQTQNKFLLCFASIFLLFSIGNRYPIAFLVYVGIGIYYFFNEEFKKDFNDYLKVGLFSLGAFILIWGIYSIFIEPGNFFSFINHNFELGGQQISNLGIFLGSFILNISQFIRLFTLPAVILMIWSIFYFWKRKSHLIRILLIYSLGTLIFFFLIPRPAFGYPRYFMTIFPGIFIIMGMFLYIKFINLKIRKNEIYLMLIVFFISIGILLILNPQITIYSGNGLIKATNLPDFLMNLSASIPLLFAWGYEKNKRKTIAILILVTLILSYSLFFIIKTINHDSNLKEVSQYIQERTHEEEIIISPKSVGHYLERRFYMNDYNRPKLDFSREHLIKYLKKSLTNREMDDEFFWPGGIYSGISPPFPSQEELDKAVYVIKYNKIYGTEPEAKIGEFYIYNLR